MKISTILILAAVTLAAYFFILKRKVASVTLPIGTEPIPPETANVDWGHVPSAVEPIPQAVTSAYAPGTMLSIL